MNLLQHNKNFNREARKQFLSRLCLRHYCVQFFTNVHLSLTQIFTQPEWVQVARTYFTTIDFYSPQRGSIEFTEYLPKYKRIKTRVTTLMTWRSNSPHYLCKMFQSTNSLKGKCDESKFLQTLCKCQCFLQVQLLRFRGLSFNLEACTSLSYIQCWRSSFKTREYTLLKKSAQKERVEHLKESCSIEIEFSTTNVTLERIAL